MKAKFLFLVIMAAVVLGACSDGRGRDGEYFNDFYTEYDEYDDSYYDDYDVEYGNYAFVREPQPRADQTVIKYSTPNGNDLKLETPRTVVHVTGAAGKDYAYYVWAGERDTSDDPNLIVRDGVAAILVEE